MPKPLAQKSLALSRTPTRLPKWWRERPFSRSDSTLGRFLSISSVFHLWDSMEVLEEQVKPPNSDGLREDGLRSQSSISWLWFRILRIMLKQSSSILRSSLLPTFSSIRLRKEEEELTELMEESLHIFLIHSILSWLPRRNPSRLPNLFKRSRIFLSRKLPRIDGLDLLSEEINDYNIYRF